MVISLLPAHPAAYDFLLSAATADLTLPEQLLHADLLLPAELLEQVASGLLPLLRRTDLPQAVDFLLDRLHQARVPHGDELPPDGLEQGAAEFVARAQQGSLDGAQLVEGFTRLMPPLLLRVQAAIWLSEDAGNKK